jgi:hypothetical protein
MLCHSIAELFLQEKNIGECSFLYKLKKLQGGKQLNMVFVDFQKYDWRGFC